MSTYKADPKDWEDIEHWANNTSSASDHCFLELRSRIKALEAAINKIQETMDFILDLYDDD